MPLAVLSEEKWKSRRVWLVLERPVDTRSPSHRGLLSMNSTSYLVILGILEPSAALGIVGHPFFLENLFFLGFYDTTLMILP